MGIIREKNRCSAYKALHHSSYSVLLANTPVVVWLALFHARTVYITVAGSAVVDRPAVTGLRRLENLQI